MNSIIAVVILSTSYIVNGEVMDSNSRVFDGDMNQCNEFNMMIAMEPSVESFQYDVEEEKWILYGTDVSGAPAEIHSKCEVLEVEEA